MKVLITGPSLKKEGGVANYFEVLLKKFSCETRYCTVGRRADDESQIKSLFRIIADFCKFAFLAANPSVKLVHINPSLNCRSEIRDGWLILLAKLFGKPVLVSFHGWSTTMETKISRQGMSLFMKQFLRADAMTVLAEEFRKALINWGVQAPIYLERTFIDDELFEKINVAEFSENSTRNNGTIKILFLARLERKKGLYEAIDAFYVLQSKFPDLSLIIAGNGSEEEAAKNYVKEKSIAKVQFTGHISGSAKEAVLRDAAIYVLPTRYAEGMPTTVVEAMAFGLPVITRPVGGLADFFDGERMGGLTTSSGSMEIADLAEKLILDCRRREEVGIFNHGYARDHFLASQAAARIETIYRSIALP